MSFMQASLQDSLGGIFAPTGCCASFYSWPSQALAAVWQLLYFITIPPGKALGTARLAPLGPPIRLTAINNAR